MFLQFKLTADKKPGVFLVFGLDANETSLVLKNLKGTVTDCRNEIKMGFYHPENKFVFALNKVLYMKEYLYVFELYELYLCKCDKTFRTIKGSTFTRLFFLTRRFSTTQTLLQQALRISSGKLGSHYPDTTYTWTR